MSMLAPTTRRPSPMRRRLLAVAVSSLPLIGGALWPPQARAAARLQSTQAGLLRLVSQPDAAAVGLAGWAALGQPGRVALIEGLDARLAQVSGCARPATGDLDDLHQAFARLVQADFAAGRCLQLGGWVLARTEVELCALAALVRRV